MMKDIIAGRLLDLPFVLGELVREKRLMQDDVDAVLSKPRSAKEQALHPLVYIASFELQDASNEGQSLNRQVLANWLSTFSDMPLYHINPLKIKAATVTQVMSFAFAKQHKILAVEVHTDHVVVATAQPFKLDWMDNLHHVLNKRIDLVVADPFDIERFSTEFYTLAHSISGASQGIARGGQQTLEAFMELGELKDPDASDKNIVTLVDWLFQYAFDQRASDIHIEPRKEEGYIRFRIDGVLHRVYDMPIKPLIAMTSRIKTMGRMNIAEKRKPQDGRLKTKTPDGQEIDLRLSTIPTAFGEKLVIRIFDPDVLLKGFEELGLKQQDFDHWKAMTSKPNGIVLVTGPTGSGKTTTLYSTLKHLATPEVNVCTIEDPIEMIEDSFNQMQVHHAIGLDFAEGVRALLRQDPDIMMICEIRDKETANMAVQAALTGHLVLSTLHTNDSPSAITRLLEIGLPSYLVKATLIGVMAQRLVRTLCEACKAKADVDMDLWAELTAPFTIKPPSQLYKPVGCLECRNTGFKGRVGIYEILLGGDSVMSSITDQTDIQQLKKISIKEGMRPLRISGAQKVAAGLTTIEEVIRVAPQVMQ